MLPQYFSHFVISNDQTSCETLTSMYWTMVNRCKDHIYFVVISGSLTGVAICIDTMTSNPGKAWLGDCDS